VGCGCGRKRKPKSNKVNLSKLKANSPVLLATPGNTPPKIRIKRSKKCAKCSSAIKLNGKTICKKTGQSILVMISKASSKCPRGKFQSI
jgi:hypothetical protein